MGSVVSKVFRRGHHRKIRVLLLGLDNAGKTTTLYRLKVESSILTVPTVGFNVESFILDKRYKLTIWVTEYLLITMKDVGGQNKLRPLWRHYYTDSKSLAFVIDSQDRDRLEEAKLELSKVVSDPKMSNACVLVFMNKIDLPNGNS